MGPDCGTAIVNGVGLGFANAVDPGTGGDLRRLRHRASSSCAACSTPPVSGCATRSAPGAAICPPTVGGPSTLRALAALDADPAVEVIVVVSKPPDPEVAAEVERAVAACAHPGRRAPCWARPRSRWRRRRRRPSPRSESRRSSCRCGDRTIRSSPGPGCLRGFFSGGTLRDEARADRRRDPRPGRHRADGRRSSHGRLRGRRVHPRSRPSHDRPAPAPRRAEAAAADPATGTVLLDVVLGYGAHPDPAAELAPVIADRGRRRCPGRRVAVRDAGAIRKAATGRPARCATPAPRCTCRTRRPPRTGGRPGRGGGPMTDLATLLDAEPVVATAGVDLLADALEAQGVRGAREPSGGHLPADCRRGARQRWPPTERRPTPTGSPSSGCSRCDRTSSTSSPPAT